jgi:hypothetical protein
MNRPSGRILLALAALPCYPSRATLPWGLAALLLAAFAALDGGRPPW